MIRLTAILTHPVQYQAPWLRHIAAQSDVIDLTVLYGVVPTPAQQGVGFGQAFSWDRDLLSGYRNTVLRPSHEGINVHSSSFLGLDAPAVSMAIEATRPDVVLITGWHSLLQVRALAACRRRGIPCLYRGDSNWTSRPGGWRGYAWEARTKLLLSQFSAYLSCGRRVTEFLDRFGVSRRRLFFTPHAVDNEFFAEAATGDARIEVRRELGLASDEFCVAFVGKLEPIKRPLDLIEAVATLSPPVCLLVVGSGELESACHARALQLGVNAVWVGRKGQADLARLYAGIDCLVLPSERETWGLVVNEALAAGRPCVVSDGVGCSPDLVDDTTGAQFPVGDVRALAQAIDSVRACIASGRDYAPVCRARVAAYDFEHARLGLEAACQEVTRYGRSNSPAPDPRILALCGGMVVVYGAERMTFEVLRVVKGGGASVHCILNSWENHRIVPLVERIGATWSEGGYRMPMRRHIRDPRAVVRMLWDVAQTSGAMLWEAWRYRPTHVFLPDFMAGVRNAPSLALLRAQGVPIVLRASTHPPFTPFYRFVWGRFLPLVVDEFVANSQFSAQRIRDTGVPPHRVKVIPNALAVRSTHVSPADGLRQRIRPQRTLLCVGQLAPFKGTHLFVDAVIRLVKEGFDIQGIVVGRMPAWPPELERYAQGLGEMAKRAGLEDRIELVGDREDVLDLMAESYVLAAPISGEEAFGNVVLEARSMGLPVVAFPTGGVVELIEHERTGYLCRDGTLEGLLEGLRFFLEDPARRAAASAACVPLPSRFTQERFARSWCDHFGAPSEPLSAP